MQKPLKVDCPTCKTKVEWVERSAYRPFCSKRCQMIDLGAWSYEEYTIPVETKEEWSEYQTTPTDQNNNLLH